MSRKRDSIRAKAETGSEEGATGDDCHMPASERRPVLVPPLQDVPKFKPRVSARGRAEAGSSTPRTGIAESRATRTTS